MLRFQTFPTVGNQRFLDIPIEGFFAGLTLKKAGEMNVKRRHEFMRRRGISKDNVFSCQQIHSRRVLNINSYQPEVYRAEQADGMITALVQSVLTVSVADCLPLFLVDQRRRSYGLVHSGWQGTGIAVEAVQQLKREYGAELGDITAIIGPSIGSCCYRVPYERYRLFKETYGARSVRKSDGAYFIDLKKTNRLLLQAQGIKDIRVITDCTSCKPSLSSFRRDGPGYVHMMAFIQRLH